MYPRAWRLFLNHFFKDRLSDGQDGLNHIDLVFFKLATLSLLFNSPIFVARVRLVSLIYSASNIIQQLGSLLESLAIHLGFWDQSGAHGLYNLTGFSVPCRSSTELFFSVTCLTSLTWSPSKNNIATLQITASWGTSKILYTKTSQVQGNQDKPPPCAFSFKVAGMW